MHKYLRAIGFSSIMKRKDYEKLIWNDIKEINKTLPDYKHIKKIKGLPHELVP